MTSEMTSYLLARMPLHTITSIHGEAGLRDRLEIESRVFTEEEQAKIKQALDLASRLHRKDKRQREPYINHLLRVAIRIVSHYGIKDAEMVCAALLHDSVEDHAAELSSGGGTMQALNVLRFLFGVRVSRLVAAVTNPEYDRSGDVYAQYRDHVTASLDENPEARIIKISDFTDNAIGLMWTTGPRAVRLTVKYAPMIPVFEDLVMRPDTPLPPAVKAKIMGQLEKTSARFAVVLENLEEAS